MYVCANVRKCALCSEFCFNVVVVVQLAYDYFYFSLFSPSLSLFLLLRSLFVRARVHEFVCMCAFSQYVYYIIYPHPPLSYVL